jgi:hypothetical protein
VIGAQCLAGGGDVGDGLGRAMGDRGLGRALAVDEAVVGDACIAQEFPHEAVILGGDPQAVTVARAELGGDRIEIVERQDIDPAHREPR